MKKLLLLPLLTIALVFPQITPDDPNGERETKLPNGKSQQEEILKVEYQKVLKDAAELVNLAGQLQDELIKDDRHVLSLSVLKKTEDIEKLAKRIRTRVKR